MEGRGSVRTVLPMMMMMMMEAARALKLTIRFGIGNSAEAILAHPRIFLAWCLVNSGAGKLPRLYTE
jgi:hypothetical protein